MFSSFLFPLRKTPGGVFLTLVKKVVTPEEKHAIFKADKAKKRVWRERKAAMAKKTKEDKNTETLSMIAPPHGSLTEKTQTAATSQDRNAEPCDGGGDEEEEMETESALVAVGSSGSVDTGEDNGGIADEEVTGGIQQFEDSDIKIYDNLIKLD